MESVIQLILWCTALLLLAVVTFIVCYSLYLIYVHNKYDHLPGPKRTSFLLGNFPELKKLVRKPEEMVKPEDKVDKVSGQNDTKKLPFEIFQEWAGRHGDTCVIFLFHHAIILTQSPVAIKQILVHGDQHDFPKSRNNALRSLFRCRIAGDGLATAIDHDSWYLRRKAVDPTFHRRKLKKAIDSFNTSGDKLMIHLHTLAERDETFFLTDLLHRAMLDVIMQVMFSVDSESLFSDLHTESKVFPEEIFNAMQIYNSTILPEVNPTLYGVRRQVKRLSESYRQRASNIIRERIALYESGQVVADDFLTMMIEAYKDPSTGYTFEILVDEFVTMIVAGMETSANSLSFIFMELGRRPDLSKRLVEEVDEIVGNKTYVSNDDITRLSFTHQLIKESLRLYPPANMIPREIRKETYLDGLRIPANSECFILISGANRNKQYIENPTVFDPDRFHPKAAKRVPTYSYIPFSLGPRNCIGQVFAQMEMKVMLTKFVQNFKLELDSSETFELGQRATTFPLSRLKGKVIIRDL